MHLFFIRNVLLEINIRNVLLEINITNILLEIFYLIKILESIANCIDIHARSNGCKNHHIAFL